MLLLAHLAEDGGHLLRTSISTSVLPLAAAESYHTRLILGLVYASRGDGDVGSALRWRARVPWGGRTAMLQVCSPPSLSGAKLDVISRDLPGRVAMRVPKLTRS